MYHKNKSKVDGVFRKYILIDETTEDVSIVLLTVNHGPTYNSIKLTIPGVDYRWEDSFTPEVKHSRCFVNLRLTL